jgi:hypothetical protein
MSSSIVEKPENISNFLALDEEYPAPAIVADNAIQQPLRLACPTP